jgi:hypothetical protein
VARLCRSGFAPVSNRPAPTSILWFVEFGLILGRSQGYQHKMKRGGEDFLFLLFICLIFVALGRMIEHLVYLSHYCTNPSPTTPSIRNTEYILKKLDEDGFGIL